jgi:hypothetical protein
MTSDAPAPATSLFEQHLRAEGYLPTVNERGHVVFKYQGLTYVIMMSAQDPAFFRLLLPGFWAAADDAERRDAYEAANHTTGVMKVAKVTIDDQGNASASAELFVGSAEQALGVLVRCLSALQGAAQTFVNRIRS